MEDVAQLRLRNYKALMMEFRQREAARGEPERGLLNRFGAFVDISPRYLSHINNGRKAIGAATARQIERASDRPHGWMDHDHLAGPAPDTRSEREYLELALRLFRQSPIQAQSLLLKFLTERLFAADHASADLPEQQAAEPLRRRVRLQPRHA